MTPKPNLLYLVPVMPALGGNGLAMRAGVILDALARDFAVRLLVVPLFGAKRISRFVQERAATVVVEPIDAKNDPMRLAAGDSKKAMALLLALPQPLLCRFATRAMLGRLAAPFAGMRFELVHVMRLYMAPYAAPFLEEKGGGRRRAVLDLDDDEVRTRARLAALYEQTGDPSSARIEAREVERYRELERVWAPRFDRVLVCSETDRERLSGRIEPDRLAVVRNAVHLPAAGAGEPPGAGAHTLLFVGTLGYFPNQDAAQILCREVLPIVRVRAGAPVRVAIVGRNPGAEVLALSRLPEVRVEADVPNLGPWYRDAAVVVLPLRAGGGTRIKLLEALAQSKPVVSTAIGAEGVGVENRRHLLLADGPEAFAAACLEILDDPELARSLGAQGRALVRARYTPEAAAADLARAYSAMYASAQISEGTPRP